MEEIETSLEEERGPAYRLYRHAQADQERGDHAASAIRFSLSLHVDSSDVHPNSLYQICWNVAWLKKWALCRDALEVLLLHYPVHEAGKHLEETLQALGDREEAFNDFLEGKVFRTPKELRRLVAQFSKNG